jgi:beta-lactamase regulating signal transducer with metallopeptidase domain
MTTPIVLDYSLAIAVKVTVVLTLATVIWLIAQWRRASAAEQHLIWTVGIVASLIVPLLGPALPTVGIPISAAAARMTGAAATQPSAVPTAISESVATEMRPTPTASVSSATRGRTDSVQTAAADHFNLVSFFFVIYFAGIALVLAGIARAHFAIRRLIGQAPPVIDSAWLTLVELLAHRAGVRARVTLLRHEGQVTPLTAGIFRPVVLIPASADGWTPARREAVLLHELAHVTRRDCLTQAIAAIACALYWPHPLAWLAAARLRLERELACDDAVLSRGVRAPDYATHLLEIARSLSAPLPRLAVSMAGVRELEDRLRSLIDDAKRRRAPGRAITALATGGACTVGLLVAAARPEPIQAAGLTISAAAAPVVVSAPSTSEFSGRFAVRLATLDDGPENQGRIHVMLMTPGINTFYIDARQLEGLRREQLSGRGLPVKFTLQRDAGTFEFVGASGQGGAQGRFTFIPNANFNRELQERGIGAVTEDQQFSLARHGVSLEFIDELAKDGYATPSPTDLVSLGTSSADLDYLREMASLGYRMRTARELLRLSNAAVDGRFVRQLATLGYRQLSMADLVQLSNYAIDASFIEQANRRAQRQLTVDELVQVRNRADESGTTSASEPPSVSAPAPPIADDTVTSGRWKLQERSDGSLQLDIEWANVNQWRRFIRVSDLSGIDAHDVASGFTDRSFRLAQDAGVFSFQGTLSNGSGGGEFTFAPNKEFASTLRSLGIRDADRIGIHQLKNLAFGFMSADAVRQFLAAGLGPLTLRDVVDMAVYHVTPADAQALAAQGEGRLTVRRLIDQRLTGRVRVF